MVYFRYFILIIALVFSIAAYPASTRFTCHTSKEMFKSSFESGFAWLASSITDTGVVLMYFINPKTDEFKIFGIDEDQNACDLLQGEGFRFVMGDLI